MLNTKSEEYRQAALSLNYELEAIFKKNLSFFKIEEPSLYQLFKNYSPKKLKLRLASEGYLNLYNVDTGNPVYDEDPLEYAKKQVDLHLKSRPTFALNLTLADNGKEGYPYTKCLSKLDAEYNRIYPGLSVKNDFSSQQMFMFGGGLFLQLEPLLNHLDVKNLSIFESNHDSFHASMHLIDWSEIYRYFSQDGYSLNFNLLGSDRDNLVKIAQIYMGKGFHHFARIEQYFHYTNDEILNLTNSFKSHLQTVIGSQGFFEDERIGLAHTLINAEKCKSICKRNLWKDGQSNSTPVFIIGNGPSLDLLESVIYENQENAIIVSCGSALSSLIKKGIKPDLHIEQERMSVVPEWIRESTTEQERKDISLIALNPCHPDTFDMFGQAYIANKQADLGTDMFALLGITDIAYAEHCLPVVGNLAISSMINLGFNNIYLAGLDCGMIKEDEHHSKDSNYFNEDKNYAQETVDTYQEFGIYTVKGNFRKEVFTTAVYNYSRVEIEALLKKYPINCFNLSDGAYIEGAVPTKKIGKFPKTIKKEELKKQLVKSYSSIDIDKNLLLSLIEIHQNKFLDYTKAIRNLFDISEKTVDQILNNFDTLEVILKAINIESKVLYRLLNGSLRGLAYKMSVAKYNLSTEKFEEFYTISKPLLDTFFEEIDESITNGFLEYDQVY